MWTLIFDYHEDRSPTHGYEATREAAMAAFAMALPQRDAARFSFVDLIEPRLVKRRRVAACGHARLA
jgi:hypothetical protein